MFNHSISRGLLLFTLRSRPPTTQAANAFSELGNLAFSGGAKLMSLFGERTTNTAASSSSDSTTSEPDLEASYAELEAVGALSEGAASLPGSAAAETGFYTVVGGVVSVAAHPPWPVPSPPSPAHPLLPPSAARLVPDQVGRPLRPRDHRRPQARPLFEAMNNNSASSRTEYSYEPMARYHALASTIKPPKGAKTTEELEVLRQSNPAYGSLAPRKDRPGRHEVSYDCMIRFNTLAPSLKTPRGFKDTAHLENLRQSDPCYGTLAPRRDRPGRHEVSYDCMDRYTSLAPLLKLPKGAKTVEHERHNRASNPCYGSLAPRKDRPGRHEVTYDPLERYTTLAPRSTPKGRRRSSTSRSFAPPTRRSARSPPAATAPGRHEVTVDRLDRYIALRRCSRAARPKSPSTSRFSASEPVLRHARAAQGPAQPRRVHVRPSTGTCALARSLRTPRGRRVEHKEVMRTSNPPASRAARYFAQAAARGSSATATRRRARGVVRIGRRAPRAPWLLKPRLEPTRSGELPGHRLRRVVRTERASNLIEALGLDEFSLKSAHSSGEWGSLENEGDYMPPTKAGLGIASRRSGRPPAAARPTRSTREHPGAADGGGARAAPTADDRPPKPPTLCPPVSAPPSAKDARQSSPPPQTTCSPCLPMKLGCWLGVRRPREEDVPLCSLY